MPQRRTPSWSLAFNFQICGHVRTVRHTFLVLMLQAADFETNVSSSKWKRNCSRVNIFFLAIAFYLTLGATFGLLLCSAGETYCENDARMQKDPYGTGEICCPCDGCNNCTPAKSRQHCGAFATLVWLAIATTAALFMTCFVLCCLPVPIGRDGMLRACLWVDKKHDWPRRTENDNL
jgi:hypothetical protein